MENLKWKGKRYENLLCHFLKPLKFVWGLPFLMGKIIFHAGKTDLKSIFPKTHSVHSFLLIVNVNIDVISLLSKFYAGPYKIPAHRENYPVPDSTRFARSQTWKRYENLLVTFWNHWNLFGVYQNGQFLTGKIIFHARKKSGKLTVSPLKNIPLTPLYLMHG